MLTPVDLENIFFRRGVRGYRVEEVQEFMSRLNQDYEHIYRENIDLKEQVESLNNKLSQYLLVEETLRNAMLLAQETAEEVKNAATKEAKLIVREAEDVAEKTKLRIRQDTENELKNLAVLKNQVEFFRCQFKSFLNGLLEVADRQLDLNIIWEQVEKKNPEAARILKETDLEYEGTESPGEAGEKVNG
ncbi:MAG: DivIVA domain-containing protein [Firmicutes bacterium]|nr:DivIVA domain-containing protein [Bacillota bacterium]